MNLRTSLEQTQPRKEVELPAEVDWKMLDKSKFFVLGAALFSGVSATLYPIMVLKTRQQVCGDPTMSSARLAIDILRQEGARAMYRGFGTTLVGTIPARALYTSALEVTKSSAGSLLGGVAGLPEPAASAAASAAAGLSASVAAQLVWTPVDIISQRLMVQTKQCHSSHFCYYSGGLNAFRTILKKDGLPGLYRGFGISVLTYAPSSALWWATYCLSQRLLWKSIGYCQNPARTWPKPCQNSAETPLECSQNSAETPLEPHQNPAETPLEQHSLNFNKTLQEPLRTPAETRMKLHPNPTETLSRPGQNSTQTPAKSHQNPSKTSSKPHQNPAENLSNPHQNPAETSSNPPSETWPSPCQNPIKTLPKPYLIVGVQALSAACAGGVAALVTTPLDTIKTRLQVLENGSAVQPTLKETVRTLLNEGGWKACYRGLGPRWTSMSISAVTMITTYEFLKRMSTKEEYGSMP